MRGNGSWKAARVRELWQWSTSSDAYTADQTSEQRSSFTGVNKTSRKEVCWAASWKFQPSDHLRRAMFASSGTVTTVLSYGTTSSSNTTTTTTVVVSVQGDKGEGGGVIFTWRHMAHVGIPGLICSCDADQRSWACRFHLPA